MRHSTAHAGGAVLTWPAATGLTYLAVAEDEQQVPWRGWLAGALSHPGRVPPGHPVRIDNNGGQNDDNGPRQSL
ncbi:hypothetical protein [Lentzea jiangxiensis]|uniref:hypothetical protein n=1 Tax=Lentzea jiangxiensis TaxID=641025 RepID=UPI00115FACD6|nr:hypothetical protein [Lentzea jiangxiensis]